MKIGDRTLIFGLLFGSAAAAAVAQAPLEPNQLTNPAEEGLRVEQITGASDPVVAMQPRSPRSADTPPQLTRSGEATPPAPQLTQERGLTRGSPQLYRGGPTAQASEPLSSPSQGRTGSVAKVEGEDRCDPAKENSQETRGCRHVIETRAAEFVRPDPTTLSPEQRLLVEQRLREAPSSSRNAARRLGTGGDRDSLETQGVASVVLGANRPKPEEIPEDQEKAAAEAAAIVNAVAGITPPQP